MIVRDFEVTVVHVSWLREQHIFKYQNRFSVKLLVSFGNELKVLKSE